MPIRNSPLALTRASADCADADSAASDRAAVARAAHHTARVFISAPERTP